MSRAVRDSFVVVWSFVLQIERKMEKKIDRWEGEFCFVSCCDCHLMSNPIRPSLFVKNSHQSSPSPIIAAWLPTHLDGTINITQILQRPIDNPLDILFSKMLANSLYLKDLPILVCHQSVLREVVRKDVCNADAELFFLFGKIRACMFLIREREYSISESRSDLKGTRLRCCVYVSIRRNSWL